MGKPERGAAPSIMRCDRLCRGGQHQADKASPSNEFAGEETSTAGHVRTQGVLPQSPEAPPDVPRPFTGSSEPHIKRPRSPETRTLSAPREVPLPAELRSTCSGARLSRKRRISPHMPPCRPGAPIITASASRTT